jgi:hypothetical protein
MNTKLCLTVQEDNFLNRDQSQVNGIMTPKELGVFWVSDSYNANDMLIILMFVLHFIEWMDNGFINCFAFLGHFG